MSHELELSAQQLQQELNSFPALDENLRMRSAESILRRINHIKAIFLFKPYPDHIERVLTLCTQASDVIHSVLPEDAQHLCELVRESRINYAHLFIKHKTPQILVTNLGAPQSI